jgi:hypothetical protein
MSLILPQSPGARSTTRRGPVRCGCARPTPCSSVAQTTGPRSCGPCSRRKNRVLPGGRNRTACTELKRSLSFVHGGNLSRQAGLEPPLRDRCGAAGAIHDAAGGRGRVLAAAPRPPRPDRACRPRTTRDLPARTLPGRGARGAGHRVALVRASRRDLAPDGAGAHGLSDAMPAHLHLTLPSAWRRRRFRVPSGLVLHHADVPSEDRSWFGAVPTTNSRRTLRDCAHEGISPELLRQAAQQALRRGLVTKSELGDVRKALKPFGGLAG